jgi:hypothetical protein
MTTTETIRVMDYQTGEYVRAATAADLAAACDAEGDAGVFECPLTGASVYLDGVEHVGRYVLPTQVVIVYAADEVPVSDDRETVSGAKYTVHTYGCAPVSGLVIPPEGPSPDCWLGYPGVELDEGLWDALAEAASEGARGRSGSIAVEVEPDCESAT